MRFYAKILTLFDNGWVFMIFSSISHFADRKDEAPVTLMLEETPPPLSDDPPPRVNADVAIVLNETSAIALLNHAEPEHRPRADSVACVIARRPTEDSYNRYLEPLVGTAITLVTTEFLQASDGCAFRVALPRGDNTPVLEASLHIVVSNSREPRQLLEQLERGEKGVQARLLLTGAIFRVAESTFP